MVTQDPFARATGRYERYKNDTRKVLNWLVDTASVCCDLGSLIHSFKNRKKSSALDLTTNEIINIARAIACPSSPDDSTPVCLMPQEILQALKNAIETRSSCASWYESMNTDGSLAEENAAHRYFILVLQKVHQLFSGPVQSSKGDSESRGHPTDEKVTDATNGKFAQGETDANMFSALEVQDPAELSEPSETTAPTTTPKQTPKPSTYLDIRLKKQEEDTKLAYWCFLQDLDDVRTYVRDTWADFFRGNISFMVASMVTDMAINFCYSADDEFRTSQGNSTEYEDIAEAIGHKALEFPSLRVAELFCPEGAKAAMTILMNIRVARFYTRKIGRGLKLSRDCQLFLDVQEDIEDSQEDFWGLGDNTEEFVHVLCKASLQLGEDRERVNAKHNLLGQAYLNRLVPFAEHGKMPMALCYATQLYIDMHNIFTRNVVYGFHVCRDAYRDFASLAKRPEINKLVLGIRGQGDFEQMKRGAEYMEDDSHREKEISIFKKRKKCYWTLSEEQQKARQLVGCSGSMLERGFLSVPAGSLWWIQRKLQTLGCEAANFQASVLTMAFLYRALSAFGQPAAEWQDMDFLIAKQTLSGKAFVPKWKGQRDAITVFTEYARALGMPAASQGTRTATIYRDRGPRRVVVTSTFDEHFDQATSEAGVDEDKVNLTVLIRAMHLLTVSSLAEDASETSQKTKQGNATFTPCQLLDSWKKTIIADEPNVYFDYLSFTADCQELLRSIAEAIIIPSQLPVFSLGFLKRSNVPASMSKTQEMKYKWPVDIKDFKPADIMFALLCLTHSLESRGVDKATSPDSPIAMAAKLIRKHVEAKGSVYRRKAHAQSSGHIPKQLRPSFAGDALERYEHMKRAHETGTFVNIILFRGFMEMLANGPEYYAHKYCPDGWKMRKDGHLRPE